MSFKKLFIGGLPFVYSDEELRGLFAGLGQVLSATMVFDPDRNRSRGFGFVEMSTPEEAQAAITQLNGKPLGEKKIFVTEARPKKPANPNKTSNFNQHKPKQFRKAGRHDGQPTLAADAPSDFKRPTRVPAAFKRFAKRDFREHEAPRERFGFRDRGPRPMSGASRGGRLGDRPSRPWQDRGPRSDRPRFDRGQRTDAPHQPPRNSDFAPRPSPWRPRDPNKKSFAASRPSNSPREKPENSVGFRRPPSGKPSKQDYWMKSEKKESR